MDDRLAQVAANDGFFMGLALAQAKEAADKGEVPVGAVVVCDGEVVGAGHNRREEVQDPTAHAEIAAIEAASRRLAADWGTSPAMTGPIRASLRPRRNWASRRMRRLVF